MAEKRFWDRCKGETRKAFAAFSLYLGMGTERTMQAAWEQHWRQTREEADGGPRGVPGHWSRWAVKWQWVARCEAHDEYQAALEQKARDEVEVAAAIAEAESRVVQKRQMVTDSLALQAAGRVLLAQCLRVIGSTELAQIGLRRRKTSDVTMLGKEQGMSKVEVTTPGALDILDLAARAAEVGQKLYRVGIGEPSDVTKQQGDTALLVRQMVEVMRDFVPVERLEELADRLRALEAKGS